jgi:hypothetical protein
MRQGRPAILLVVVSLSAGCSTVGHRFNSEPERLARLVVGETTPEEAVRILDGEPYIRQNLPDGTLAWHWQRIAAGAYVGVTDNRYLVLQFTSPDGGNSWRFQKVIHAQNIDLPAGMPFGTVAK